MNYTYVNDFKKAIDGNYIVNNSQKCLAKGTFVNGRITKGELWTNCNWIKSIFESNYWLCGTFENNKLHGEGIMYSDYEKTKIYKKGIFEHGNLIRGEVWTGEDWWCGSFKYCEFEDKYFLHDDGIIYSDYEKIKISHKGKFVNDVLISGEYCDTYGNLHCGYFGYDSYGSSLIRRLNGLGIIYTNCNKEQICQKGVFVDGQLIHGDKYNKSQIYHGAFMLGELHGQGIIYADVNKEQIYKKGIFQLGVLIYGEEWTGSEWHCGFFEDKQLRHGIKYSNREKTVICQKGIFIYGRYIPDDSDNLNAHQNDPLDVV